MSLMNYVSVYLLKGKSSNSSEFYHILRTNPVKQEVIDYIYNIILPLKVKVRDNEMIPARCLFNQGKFIGWCWETTQTIAPLISNASIVRGYIFFKGRNKDIPSLIEYKTCEHAWIYFEYNGVEYAFDPCLKIICLRSLYDETFEVNITKEIPTLSVGQEICDALLSAEPSLDGENKIYKVNIRGSRSKCNNIYAGNIDYIAKFQNNKILSLEAHYIGHW